MQILNSTVGYISSEWMLFILASLVGGLGLKILNNISHSIKDVVARQNVQEKEITKATERAEYAHERIDRLDELNKA